MSVDAKGNGVWVAKDLWRNMRHQLDQKATDYVHIQDEHNRIVSQLTEEITQLKDNSLALKQANALLDHQGQEEGRAHAATVQTLNAELEALRLQLSASKHEHRQQVDSLMRMLSERDRAAETASSLSRSLDDAAFKLKLEDHRASISDGRIEARKGDGATLIVSGPGVERFTESKGWHELEPGEYPVSNRIVLKRGEELFLEFRR